METKRAAFISMCCASAFSTACSLTGYWGRDLSAMQREPKPATRPLARHVVWLMEVQLLDNQPDFYLTAEELPEEADKATIVWPEEAQARGYEVLERALGDARRRLTEDERPESRAAIQELEALIAGVRPLQPASSPQISRAIVTGNVGKTARFGLASAAFVALAQSSTSDDIQKVVDWALKETGLVGPEAPAGSILFAFMQRRSTSVDFGWKWDQSAQLVLVRDGASLSSGRRVPWWIYSSEPDAPPQDMVLSRAAYAVEPGEKPTWLALYYDTAMLLRSAGYELAHAQRALDAARVP